MDWIGLDWTQHQGTCWGHPSPRRQAAWFRGPRELRCCQDTRSLALDCSPTTDASSAAGKRPTAEPLLNHPKDQYCQRWCNRSVLKKPPPALKALPETAPNAKTPRCSRSHSHYKAAMVYEEQAPPAEQRSCPCVRRRGTHRSKLQGTKVYDETAPTAKPPRTGSHCQAAKPPRRTKKELPLSGCYSPRNEEAAIIAKLQGVPRTGPHCQMQRHGGVRRSGSQCQAAKPQGARRAKNHCQAARPPRCTRERLPLPSCKAAQLCTKNGLSLQRCKDQDCHRQAAEELMCLRKSLPLPSCKSHKGSKKPTPLKSHQGIRRKTPTARLQGFLLPRHACWQEPGRASDKVGGMTNTPPTGSGGNRKAPRLGRGAARGPLGPSPRQEKGQDRGNRQRLAQRTFKFCGGGNGQ